jgi:hypothetical protein
MYKLEHISAACGPKLVAYVRNKTTGGTAGQKGTRYEDRLAVLKIGEAAKSAFSRNGKFSATWNVTFQGEPAG